MAVSVRYLPDCGVVLIESSGELSFEDVHSADTQAKACAAENEASRFLYDDRRARLQFSFNDYFELQGSWQELGFKASDQVAIVYPEDAAQRENYDFFETVCRNRGLDVRMCVDRDEALALLTATHGT